MRLSIVAVWLCLALTSIGCAHVEEKPPAAPSPSATVEVAVRPSPSVEAQPSPRERRRPSSTPRPARPTLAPLALRPSQPASDIALQLPAPPHASALLPADLKGMLAGATASNAAASWRAFADRAAKAGFYAEAAEAYRREAAVYRHTGDGNAAQVEELKAAQYASSIDLFAHRVAMPWDYGKNDTGARLEPRLGCYVGAFIDRDDNIPSEVMQNQRYGDVAVFGERVGKPHASYFMYRSYEQDFPAQWAAYLKRNGAIPHIAWEPKSLAEVRDDAHLARWVEQARALDWPIFIRFAGEMNGDWTPYHGNPAAYRAAFRRVYNAFRKAPRVALIWCPNTIPENGLDAYYPGDDACDWVGVNFYNVLYLDNDRARPGDKIHPTDLLDYVYRKYSARKPIAIAEYAATHQAKDGPVQPEFATDKIAQLYAALPTRYPRVKMVDWYDCNNLRHAAPGRQLNNYLLTDVEAVLEAYRQAVAHPWFLGAEQVKQRDDAHFLAVPLRGGEKLPSVAALEASVRTYVAHPKVYFELDGKLVYATQKPDRYVLVTPSLAPGRHQLEVMVYDDRGRFVLSRQAAFEV